MSLCKQRQSLNRGDPAYADGVTLFPTGTVVIPQWGQRSVDNLLRKLRHITSDPGELPLYQR